MAWFMVATYTFRCCCLTNARWMSISSTLGGSMSSGEFVQCEFMIKPSRSSFGEHFKDGSIQSLRCLMAASRWSGQLQGRSSFIICSYLSLPRPGVHSHLSMLSSKPLDPSNSLFRHREYATMMCNLVPILPQYSKTSLQSKWLPLSTVRTSRTVKVWVIFLRFSTVFSPLPL